MTGTPVALGIDVGTSGARVAALDAAGDMVASEALRFAPDADLAEPDVWWQAASGCLDRLRAALPLDAVTGLAVDGTSGTVLGLDAAGMPVGPAIMYNVPCPDAAIVAAVDAAAPADSPARGANSALARAIALMRRPGVVRVLHQADWIAAKIVGFEGVSDANNALKTGYDPIAEAWPAWIADAGMPIAALPPVVAPGRPVRRLGPAAGERFGLPPDARLHGGTTDGCASFLATGASAPGDAVTALGSTLVLKLFSDRPISAPQFGIYSHRMGDLWLVGGASNTGGAVLRHFFDDDDLARLTPLLAPDRPTGLDYYPLLKPGERFPVNDPAFAPRLTPRPENDAVFLQGLLEGIAQVEAMGYRKLDDLGAPPLRSVRTVGGGAVNTAWSDIRQTRLGVPFLPARAPDAAAGTARLVLGKSLLP
ncbi:FGGY-family carbohydrate kinase [Pseudooceanicola nanhaiensis]|uniref:FGGY-family carbohydrate kinase n=1 Tax=Pseudooceanicola nanhaiensis TaxID=375761 RepID=UPI004057E4C9